MNTLTTRASRLTYARVKAGYEDAIDFCRTHGIKQPTYSQHESGKRNLRAPIAEKYAKMLGNCEPMWLMYGKGDGPDDLPSPRYLDGDGPTDVGAEIDRESEEVASFMLLFDRLTALTEQHEKTGAEELGIVFRPFGVRPDRRGVAHIAFLVWRRQIINVENDLSLPERVLKWLEFFEGSMTQLLKTLREVDGAIKGRPRRKK